MAEVVVFGVVAADVVLRVQRIPTRGDHVNAEALGWRIGGSSANLACGLSTAGHHVRLVGPVGRDSMGDNLLAELERYGVDTEYSFRAGAATPRTLILLDDTGERTIIAVDSGAELSSFLPTRGMLMPWRLASQARGGWTDRPRAAATSTAISSR
jgi:sugar/nucleoside kinase (ribokinase family)